MILGFKLHEATTKQVARALLSSGAYKININKFFEWKSGIKAPVYVNCRELDKHPGAKAIVVCALESSIRANFPSANWIVGVSEAGPTWSAPVAFQLGRPHSIIRKDKKEHGDPVDRWIISAPNSKTSSVDAVIVDDLLASGETLENKINCFENETGFKPIGVQTVVNWNFAGFRERFKKLKIKTCALVSYPQILESAFDFGLLNQGWVEELTRFYENPKEHEWSLDLLHSPVNLRKTL